MFRDSLRIEGDALSYAKYKRVTGDEMVALTRPGPNGESPVLRPGDMILNGSGGTTGHVVVYVGNNSQGEPEIVHAMATQYEGRSFVQRLWDATRLVFGWVPDKIGVIRETIRNAGDHKGFFDRYFRDTVIIVRDPRMTPAMRDRFLEQVGSLVGKKYDFGFNSDNQDYFCSEVVKAGLAAAYEGSGKPLPWFGTSWMESGVWPVKVAQWIPQPENLALSPDIDFVWANDTGRSTYEEIHRTMVCGKRV